MIAKKTRRPTRAEVARSLWALEKLWKPPPENDDAPGESRGIEGTELHNNENSTPASDSAQRGQR